MNSFFQRYWFAIVLVCYVAYALAFIYTSSFVVDGKRYFVLLDDAMISMTYARTLAAGEGAVWYPGAEPVQGYSNPLWMLIMAVVHLLPLPPRLMSLPIQLLGVVFIGGSLYFVKRIAEQLSAGIEGALPPRQKTRHSEKTASIVAPFFAVLLTAFYFPLNNWTLRGMEVGAVSFGVTCAVWAALRCADGKSYEWWLLPVLGLLTTVRMDAGVAGAAILAWLWWCVPERRRFNMVWGVGWLAFFVLGQMLAQKLYYGEWLPNTYYLKLEGIPLVRRVLWGSYVLLYFCVGFGLWLIMAAGVYALVERTKAAALLLAVIVSQAAYSIYVGGDAWEWWGGANRYLCVAMPLVFTLLGASLERIREGIVSATGEAFASRATIVVVGLGILAMVQVNAYSFGIGSSLSQLMLVQKPQEWIAHDDVLKSSFEIQKITNPEARIAVIWAGIIPYFSQRVPIDLLGKCDRKIAHGYNKPFEHPPLSMFANSPVAYCWPGHSKRNYQYSLGQLRPDVIQMWLGMDEPGIAEFLQQNYAAKEIGPSSFYVDTKSKNLDLEAGDR